MPDTDALYHWTDRVARGFPELSRPQATALAWYSFGMALAHTCGLDAVALHLALYLARPANTLRQRLRELYQPAAVKCGRRRTELDPALCFGPLLRWLTAGWADRRLALALDPTSLGGRFTVLAASVVYRGGAVPVAWRVLAADQKGSWNAHWKALLGRLHAELGGGWEVLVLTDRGLESAELFRSVAALGWHPLMRAKAAGTFRPEGWAKRRPMGRFAGAVGRRWRGAGVAYGRESALACTLLACWEAGHDEPRLLLTDLAPASANPAWYAWRGWIEQGFRAIKRGGWRWQRTRMADPERAARLWAALALATLWLLEAGGEAERLRVGPLPRGGREHRLFRLGPAAILLALLRGELPGGSFRPEPWPEAGWASDPLTEQQLDEHQTYP
jgi:hypothetical protein